MLLALELSGPRNTLALGDGNSELCADFSAQRGRALMQAVDDLFHQADCERKKLRGILVGTGPGSYTGLRIACSAGIMLGYALDVPCGGLSSFAAAAFAHGRQNEALHLLLNAYRKEVYHAIYQRTGTTLEELCAPHVLAVEDAAAAVGTAPFLGEAHFAPASIPRHTDCQASASHLLRYALAHGVTADGKGIAALGPAEPLYLRPAAFRL